MRRLLAFVIAIVVGSCAPVGAVLSDTVNVIARPGANFTRENQEFQRDEDADRLHETFCRADTFVHHGCLGPTAASLTHTPTSCLAYARGFRVTEVGAITYPDNATCWVIYDRNVSGNLTSNVAWTRVGSTHYLLNCTASSQPVLPDPGTNPDHYDTGFLMEVHTSAGAITVVSDLRNFGTCAPSPACLPNGSPCTVNSECCVGLCTDDVCGPPLEPMTCPPSLPEDNAGRFSATGRPIGARIGALCDVDLVQCGYNGDPGNEGGYCSLDNAVSPGAPATWHNDGPPAPSHSSYIDERLRVTVALGHGTVAAPSLNQGTDEWFQTDTPGTCDTDHKGAEYDDLSENVRCRCNGTAWCRMDDFTACGTATDCFGTPATGGSIFCDVTQHGAVPDDGIDDTAAFQKCFNIAVGDPEALTEDCGSADALAFNHSGIVYAPAGTYDICNLSEDLTFDTGILFSDGASLLGDGADATILRCRQQLGGCTNPSGNAQGRVCSPAIQVSAGPCNYNTGNFYSDNGEGPFLKGFTLFGPGTIQANPTPGRRTANTDGIVLTENITTGMRVEGVVVAGFDTGLVNIDSGSIIDSSFVSNFDHIEPSEESDRIDNVILGAAGRAGFLLSVDNGFHNARVRGRSTGDMPYLVFQPQDSSAVFSGGPAFQHTTLEWAVGQDLGNALIYSYNAINNDDVGNDECVGSHAPFWCCTGSGTGTCPTPSGDFIDTDVSVRFTKEFTTASVLLAADKIGNRPSNVLVRGGSLRGRNRLRISRDDGYPATPQAGSTTNMLFRSAISTSGTHIRADDPTADIIVLADATNVARVKGCDDLDSCSTVTTFTTTTTVTTTSTLPSAGEACNNPTSIAGTAGTTTASSNLSGKANNHYAAAYPSGIATIAHTQLLTDDTSGPDLVYSVTPANSGTMVVTTCGTSFNGLDLSVRQPCHSTGVTTDGLENSEGETLARCKDDNGRVWSTANGSTACSPDATGGDGCTLQLHVTASQTYYILVDTTSTATPGAFTLHVTKP